MRFWIYSQEHQAWWKPNHTGYTRDFTQAGTYSLQDTARILEGANFAREHGMRVNEYAVLVTIVFDRIPQEMLDVESEKGNAG